jgi:hypothetical protein
MSRAVALSTEPAIQGTPAGWVRWRSLASRLTFPPELRRAILIVTGLRVGLGLVAWFSLTMTPAQSSHEDYLGLREATASALWPVVGPWQRWDALWYQHLAADGYRGGTGDAAFFPLFPAAVRLVGAVTGDLGLAGLVVSTIAFIAALTLLDRLVSGDLGKNAGRRAVLHIALAPTAFFFLAGYSEAMLLALSVGALLAARQRRWGVAGLVGSLAALSRPTGALICVPLAVEVLQDASRRHGAGRPRFRRSHLLALAPAAALAAYTVYIVSALGVAGGSFGAAARWGQHLELPWVSVGASLRTALRAGFDSEEVLNLSATGALLAAVPVMWRRLPASYVAYAAVTVPVLCFRTAAMTPLMSADRYVLAVFPLFALLAVVAMPRWLRAAALVGSGAWMAALTVDFVHAHFIG